MRGVSVGVRGKERKQVVGITHLFEQAGGLGSTPEEVIEVVTPAGTDSVAALWGEKRKNVLSSEDSPS